LDLIQALISLLGSAFPATQRQAAKAIANLAVKSENKQVLMKHNALPSLLNLASSGISNIQTEAIAAIANLSVDDDNEVLIGDTLGGVKIIMTVLSESLDDDVLAQGARAIRNLSIAHVNKQLATKPNIQFLDAKIHSFFYEGVDVCVSTDQGDFHASQKVFDSISPFACDFENPKHIKQHFLGWTIESHFPVFKQDSADLFDFRVAFDLECEFMYVLPTSPKKALFEYTFFSGKLRDKIYYRDKLKAYLLAYYGFGEDEYNL
jgi:hypothetical protein